MNPSQDITAMRCGIADERALQIFQKNNTTLRTLIVQSMFDWWHNPLENNGRNGAVLATIQAWPVRMPETEWFDSKECLTLHSSLIRTGTNEVFADPRRWRRSV